MIRFFKVNDPYRLLAVFLFLTAVRVTALFLDIPYLLLHEESEQMAQAINSGNLTIDGSGSNAGPLYAYFYALLTLLSQDTLVLSVLLSAIFVMIQAFILNTILIRLAAFNENTYIPAIVYAILMSASPEYLLIGPEMVATTFVLIGINFLLTHLKYRGTEENIISTGFMFGLASLFAKPAFFLLPFTLLVYVLYSSTLNRRYFLMTFGFAMPFLFAWLFYFWQDAGAMFWSEYFGQLVHIQSRHLIANEYLLSWLGFPVFMALIAAAQHFTGVGMTNNQIQFQRSMLWLGIFGLIGYLVSANGSFNELIWIMPAITYFITLLMNAIQKSWMAELGIQLMLWGALYFTVGPLIDRSLSLLDLSGLLLP